jgi:5S rRNA maturation endonuclease (ribonuclease M5)
MRTTDAQRYKYALYRELELLVFDMNHNVDAVVVEGPHDKRTLKILGYEKPIVLCSKISNTQLADILAHKFSTVTILSDYDEEGITINKALTRLLERRGIKIDRYYRNRIGKLLGETGIRTIEGIYNLKLELFPL